MDSPPNIKGWLNLSGQPAFCVQDGIIIAANPAAMSRFVPVNEPVEELLLTGQKEYAEFSDGWLCLTLRIGGTDYGASVRRIDQYHIFTLEPDTVRSELQTLALVSQELRTPLSNVMTISDHLFPSLELEEDSPAAAHAAHLNQGLHQLLRIIGNMSNAARFSGATPNFITQDVDALLREQFEHAAALCKHRDIRVEYTGLAAPAYSLIDSEQLEQSIYQIISNSMNHTPKGGCIHAKLTRRGNTLRLTVQDSGSGLSKSSETNPFDRFLREPSVTDPERGIGLGMRIIHSFATAHGGTVLLTSPEDCGLRLMLTLPIRLDTTGLRSPMTRVSYSGERDSGLIALSDSLPPELYMPHKK